jgi:hypothetical protein
MVTGELGNQMRFPAADGECEFERRRSAAGKEKPIVTHVVPAALVGLTALITSGLVHAGYGIWWLSQSFFRAQAMPYDWAGALAVSGTATTIVLIAGLVVRRLTAGNAPPAEPKGTQPEAVAVRVDR